MIGPVLRQELLLGGRRQRLYLFRWVYAGWLVVLAIYCYVEYHGQELERRAHYARDNQGFPPSYFNSVSAPQAVGAHFTDLFLYQQLIVLGLVVPALVAGAVTDEKQRGTLQYLLTANLDARHIILGKLVARSGLVGLLLLTGMPLFALLAGFGGVSPFTVLLVFVVLIVPVFALASISLLASVWSRSTVDAVAGSYVVQIVLALIVWRLGPDFLNPLYVVEPARVSWDLMDVGAVGKRLLLSMTGWVVLGGIPLGLAVGRLRASYVRQLEGGPAASAFWYGVERAPVSDDPIHWRERNVEGLAPLATLRRFPTWFSVVAIIFTTFCSSIYLLASALKPGKSLDDLVRAAVHFDAARLQALLPGAEIGFLVQAVVVLVIATLTVAVRSAIAVTGEREKQTWDSMLTSPLSTKDMVQSKLWGITGASYWYLLAYGAPAAILSVLGGVMAFFWTLLGIGVTVLAMYFVGAAGLYCSVKSKTSWRSLLTTLGMAYGGGALVLVVTGFLSVVPAAVFMLLLVLADAILGTNLVRLAGTNWDTFLKLCLFSSGGLLALAFWLLSRLLLRWASGLVSDAERTRHWMHPPLYRRARRRKFPARR